MLQADLKFPGFQGDAFEMDTSVLSYYPKSTILELS